MCWNSSEIPVRKVKGIWCNSVPRLSMRLVQMSRSSQTRPPATDPTLPSRCQSTRFSRTYGSSRQTISSSTWRRCTLPVRKSVADLFYQLMWFDCPKPCTRMFFQLIYTKYLSSWCNMQFRNGVSTIHLEESRMLMLEMCGQVNSRLQ